MRLARVIGTVVSSVQDPRFDGQKLLLVQPVDDHANPVDRTLLAVDAAQAGVGDYVLVVQEGKSARAVMGVADAPCEAIIVGVVDHVQTGGEQRALTPPPTTAATGDVSSRPVGAPRSRPEGPASAPEGPAGSPTTTTTTKARMR